MFIAGTLLFLIFAGLVIIATRQRTPLEKRELKQLPPSDIIALEDYIKSKERFARPKPGTEKSIYFPRDCKVRKTFSFVYLHGFSATRAEISPVMERVAERWDVPLFFTRFAGHGLSAEALGKSKKDDWIQDALEAYHIGRSLGDEVILTCMSTGCALGLYLAYYFPKKIKALILLSPNFAPADPRAFLAQGSLGELITSAVVGDYHGFTPANSQQAYYWTHRYGSAVLPEMISLVAATREMPLEKIEIPTLTLYTPFDRVIDASEIERQIPRLGSPINKIIALVETQAHVLAGDIMNPIMNEKVIREINQFLEELRTQ